MLLFIVPFCIGIRIKIKATLVRCVRDAEKGFLPFECSMIQITMISASFSSSSRLDPSPRDIRVQRINDTAIHVSWSPILYPPVERYIIHYNDKSENKPGNLWSLYSPIDSAATSAIISGLKPSAMYNVRVSAEFSSSNLYDPSYQSSSTRREGDLSEIHVADIYRRKCWKKVNDLEKTGANFVFDFIREKVHSTVR